jgi:hypothetical protein
MKLLSVDDIRQAFPALDRPSAETIRRYIRAGSLAGAKFGGTWYVSERALQRFLEGVPAPPPDPEKAIPI